jgi:hypothetical protein
MMNRWNAMNKSRVGKNNPAWAEPTLPAILTMDVNIQTHE